jgi:hypothetical protein
VRKNRTRTLDLDTPESCGLPGAETSSMHRQRFSNMSPAASAFGGQELLRLLAFDTELPEHLHGLDRVPGVSRQPRPSAREARRAAGRRRRVT